MMVMRFLRFQYLAGPREESAWADFQAWDGFHCCLKLSSYLNIFLWVLWLALPWLHFHHMVAFLVFFHYSLSYESLRFENLPLLLLPMDKLELRFFSHMVVVQYLYFPFP